MRLEVAHARFASIAEEMGAALRRAAYSPNIKERADLSCAVFRPEGDLLAQAEHIPVHLGSMPASVAAVLGAFGAEVTPGTQFAVNDPFAGGTHLNDLTLVAPVFRGDELVGFVANRAHHADVGGEAPGSMPAHAHHIDQEGFRVPPTQVQADGRWIADWFTAFADASRTPAERAGDLAAQAGANALGARRLLDVLGDADPAPLYGSLLEYGERRMRAALRALPDGVYRCADALEWPDGDVPIVVTVTIAEDTLTADFTGTGGQVHGNVNAVEAVTRSCVYFAVRCVADPDAPTNAGTYRPVRLVLPPRSLLSAEPPVAVAAGNVETAQRIADVLLGALAGAAPQAVGAANQGTMNNFLVGGEGPGGAFVYYETIGGGQGGRPGKAGASAVQTGMTNTQNTPVEVLETHYPVRVRRYSIRRGSGGRGRFAGGDGIERELELRVPATVSLLTDRRSSRPFGLDAGEPGQPGENMLRRGGVETPLAAKVTFDVQAGDVVVVRTPGGGGLGPAGGVTGKDLEERSGRLVIPLAGAGIDGENVRTVRDADER